MATVSTNITLEKAFWKRCKKVAIDRGISLNQLVKNGLMLTLEHGDWISESTLKKAAADLLRATK